MLALTEDRKVVFGNTELLEKAYNFLSTNGIITNESLQTSLNSY